LNHYSTVAATTRQLLEHSSKIVVPADGQVVVRQQQRWLAQYVQYDGKFKRVVQPPAPKAPPKPTPTPHQPGSFVWNEPSGRMKMILDNIRYTSRRLSNMKDRDNMRLLEILRRTRISNNAMIPRLDEIQERYEHCSYGLHDIRKLIHSITQHFVPNSMQHANIVPRRKYNFDYVDGYTVRGENINPTTHTVMSDKDSSSTSTNNSTSSNNRLPEDHDDDSKNNHHGPTSSQRSSKPKSTSGSSGGRPINQHRRSDSSPKLNPLTDLLR
jgi:hypothetical protein